METLENLVDPAMDRKIADAHKNIPGWGMDADPENDPTYPMKNRTGADYERIHYERAPQQQTPIEVLQSIERPAITRVFGTSTPPTGLSGALRRYAFKYSEANGAHWMTLILADRVDVVQGIIADLKNGIVPNLFAEWGWKAEWEHNRTKFVGKLAVRLITVSLVIAWLTRKKKKSSSW
jgi:hypothetical protein